MTTHTKLYVPGLKVMAYEITTKSGTYEGTLPPETNPAKLAEALANAYGAEGIRSYSWRIEEQEQ
jgi:hypothetical protein